MSIDNSSINGSSSVLDQYAVNKDSSGTATAGKSNLGKDEFLKLLVAQMNNQDPMSPQENGEFIAQLAQFSTVEGIQSLNTSMDSVLSNYQSSQALQASSLVGRKVIVPTEKSVVDTAETFKGTYTLPVTTSNSWVNIYDDSGTLVNRVDMGQQTAGNVSFMWDGKDSSGNLMPPGRYKFEAQTNYEGKTYGLTTFLPANVDSVTLGQNGGELTLNLAGLGSIGLSKVQIIGQ
ncbi:MAG: flagellar hook assembly protein FlgD [Pseudomonas sp.]|uniref:flagellar hook assembly protein FlgD n=1 Tax=Pseudomonas sp. TaxID=306 RepID=UPI000CA721D7|nr:flagellar hook assembly protein FlgD [Pseudomonas sp.]PJI49542.1 MAG: flagellar hook assembly protein FlgD [Pseudomonas sp.]